jgi:hypothetical protein
MPRPRRSREEWCKLTATWRTSGQSGVDFARANDLNPNTFAWWRSELARTAPSTPLTLVPIASLQHQPAVEPLEVVLLSGVTVRVPAQTDPTWVARLVHALEDR